MACEDDESFWCFHRKLGICRLVKYIFVKNPLQSGCRQIGRKYSNSEPAALLANTGAYSFHPAHQHSATGDGILPRVVTQDSADTRDGHINIPKHCYTFAFEAGAEKLKRMRDWQIFLWGTEWTETPVSLPTWCHVSAPNGNINCQQRQCHDPSDYAITTPHIEL